MADIELVIKIPEEIYKASQIIDVEYEDVVQIPLEVIKNSTPLPKGHGRIVDISQIECLEALHDANFGYITWSEAIKQIKNSASTLVEADTESEDNE